MDVFFIKKEEKKKNGRKTCFPQINEPKVKRECKVFGWGKHDILLINFDHKLGNHEVIILKIIN